jgi:tetratricopeptide (TPR) repeat protein
MSVDQIAQAQKLAAGWKPSTISAQQSSTILANAGPPNKDDVVRAQRLLMQLGNHIGIADGTVGPRTSAAISAFQKRQGLTEDGKITALLISALQNEVDVLTKQAQPHFVAGFDALNYDIAISEFNEGLRIKDDAEAEYYLGKVYRVKGNNSAALVRFRRSLVLDPASKVADKAQQEESELAAALGTAAQQEEQADQLNLKEHAAHVATAAQQTAENARKALPIGTWIQFASRSYSDHIKSWKETLTIASASAASLTEEDVIKITNPETNINDCPDGTFNGSYVTEQNYSVAFDANKQQLILHPLGPYRYTNIYPTCMKIPEGTHNDYILHWDGSSLSDQDTTLFKAGAARMAE